MRGENSFLNQNNNNKEDDHDKNEDDLETSNKETPEKCTACALGQFSTAGSASCNKCAINEYQDSTGGTGCKTCPFGWFTFTKTGQANCLTGCPILYKRCYRQ